MTPSQVAAQYLGKTEKPGNSGFTDADFEQRMSDVGFKKSHAWCAYFTELVFKEAYPAKFAELDKLFSASAVQTFRNFQKHGYIIKPIPVIDSLVIWQSYKKGVPQVTGHAGIVSKAIDSWQFESIEGNTSSKGVREGYIVGPQKRKVLAEVTNGLKVMGFVII